jgi:hypothetical protein
MPETTPGVPDGAPENPTTTPAPPAPAAPEPAPAQGSDLKAELEKLTREARKWEDRAKANATAAKELETLRQQSMTDQERAVAEAKAAGRQEAIATFATQLVDAEIRAVAAGLLDPKALNVLLQGLNRQAFLLDDGTVDTKSVREFIEGIAPPPPPAPPERTAFDLGQGARGDAMALNGDPLLRDIKNKLGIA